MRTFSRAVIWRWRWRGWCRSGRRRVIQTGAANGGQKQTADQQNSRPNSQCSGHFSPWRTHRRDAARAGLAVPYQVPAKEGTCIAICALSAPSSAQKSGVSKVWSQRKNSKLRNGCGTPAAAAAAAAAGPSRCLSADVSGPLRHHIDRVAFRKGWIDSGFAARGRGIRVRPRFSR